MLGRLGEVIIHTSHKYGCGGQVCALEHARHLGMVRLTAGSGAVFGEKRQKMLGGHLSGKDKEGAGMGGLQGEPGHASLTEQGGRHNPVHLGGVGGTPHCLSPAEGSRLEVLDREDCE
jgi:hypothetical protein